MYRGAQISSIFLLTCLTGVSVSLTSGQEANSTSAESVIPCPAQCICLSSKQALCNTGGLREIPTSQFTSAVEELSLTKNNITIIKSDAFVGLRNLRKLSLDGNNITMIKSFAFRGLNKLTDISIQNTPLRYVGQYSFATLQNVTSLLLAYNRISYIESSSFAGTSYVKLILLSNNPLITIHSKAFSGLTNVEHLIFPSGLQVIEPDAFNGLQNVGQIKLTFMDLSSLQPFTFRGLSNIARLNIQESDLGAVRVDAFTGLSHVDSLNIMNNKIDVIEELRLTNENAVGVFRFTGNHVLSAPRAKDTNFNVNTILAVNNHFPCDCQIHDVLESDLINASVEEFRMKNFCISPIEYNGRSMSLVDFDGIARCHDKVMQDNLGSGGQRPPPRSLLFVPFVLVFSFTSFQPFDHL
ncbi:nyctalopin-like [Venturia canescens]|uniref:nyctalopin-like n=1 Tax=Venturia canescens TaxID=32260 RepID=UPI001C9C2F9E|nr:nyctalopin-like [Venturia canescens]